ncbi:hypothetical protein AEM42_06310 [Betaproteobacteria bacterium UKL13-2]|nr:hypothetical protein AEM42_06310 [Betaproteobacteria bacterium UKL13-2]HCG52910.1 hypothetical protein [Betaproteobacteria bacterium]
MLWHKLRRRLYSLADSPFIAGGASLGPQSAAARRLVNAGWLIALALFGGLHLYYVTLASPQVPYMDSIYYLGDVFDAMTGAASWRELWDKRGSGGLLYQLVLLFEWVFWGLNAKVTVVATALAWAILFLLYARVFSKLLLPAPSIALTKRRALLFLLAQLFIAFYLFSPAGWEIWLLDLGFAQTLKNLVIAVYLHRLARFSSHNKSPFDALCMGAIGAITILFVAYNWSYSFTVAATFVVLIARYAGRISRVAAICLFLPILAAQFLYASAIKVGLNTMAVARSIDGLWDFVAAALYGAGSIFVGSEALEFMKIGPWLPMMAGVVLLLLAAIVLSAWTRFGDKDEHSIFFASICVFGLCVLGSIAVARGGLGTQSAAASRYFMDYQFVLIGVIGLVLAMLANRTSAVRWAPSQRSWVGVSKIGWIIVGLLSVMASVGHLATYFIEYKKAPHRATYFQAQQLALLSGQATQAHASILQTQVVHLAKAMPIIDEFNLVSRRSTLDDCSLKHARTYGEVYAQEPDGRWMGGDGEFVLARCPAELRIEGFLPASEKPRTLTLQVNNENYQVALRPGEGFALDAKRTDGGRVVRVKASIDMIEASAGRAQEDLRKLGVFFTKMGQ